MESVTMTFVSKDSAGAVGFLNAVINEGASNLEKAQVGDTSANVRDKEVENSVVFRFSDATAATAFRQADKSKLATNFGITEIKFKERSS